MRSTCKIMGWCLLVVLLTLPAVCVWAEDESATPEEVIERVTAAAAFLAEKGEAGLVDFTKESEWVWKDTYVWVNDCENWTALAHPINPKFVGRNLKTLKDFKGKLFWVEFCEAVKKPDGGWVEYVWSKPGEKTPSRKIAYNRQVPGQPFQVGAGIYNETISLKELNTMLEHD